MSLPIDIKKRRLSADTDEHGDLSELFQMKLQLTDLIESYVEKKLQISLKKFSDNLSIELTNKLIEDLDRQTTKLVEKIVK